MKVPDGLMYTRSHLWLRREDGEVVLGMTDYGQDLMGELVYVELPAAGVRLEAGAPLAVVESVKSVAEVVSPVAGEVVAVNAAVAKDPEAVNRDPYGSGWLVRLRLAAEPEGLMSPQEYRVHTGEEE